MSTAPNTAAVAPNDFFSPAANIKPYLKVAAQGFAGTGKTFTLSQIAAELLKQRKRLDDTTPMRVAMIDTEKSSGFLRRVFEGAGIELMVKETRSLTDVIRAIDLCESGYAPILMLDSLTHIYENFVEVYKRSKNRTRLEMLDWGILKPRWKDEFSSRFVRSRVDILFTGRAGYEYDSTETTDERTGKKKIEIYKSGVKMKVDGETAYEPDIVLHMERFEELLEDEKKVYRTCTVLKDRSGLLDGKTLKNPTGVEFAPVFDYLLTNPVAASANGEAEGDDSSLFDDDASADRQKLNREILLEKIEETIRKAAPGQTAQEKTYRQGLMESCFGTLSWREVTVSKLEHLRAGLAKVEAAIAGSREKKKAADAEGLKVDPTPDPTPAAPAAHAANGSTDPGTDAGAEVSVVKPLDEVTRKRMRRGIEQYLNATFSKSQAAMQYLWDATGRDVLSVKELTDEELTKIHSTINQKAAV